MPHEKIISGDLDGDGVEGQRKKIKGGEFPRKEKEPEPELSSVPERGAGSGGSKETGSGDLFYTGFGSAKPKDTELPRKTSRISDDSDIFDTGFGSATQKKREKLVHVTGSAERKEAEKKREEKKATFSDSGGDELFGGSGKSSSSTEETTASKKSGSLEKDPFYTGFGYTDQRGKNSPADGGLFPDGDRLPKMPEKELMVERPETREDILPEEPEDLLEEEIIEEKPKPPQKPKTSVLTRDDDDLFS